MNSNKEQDKASFRALSRKLSAATSVLIVVFVLLVIIISVVNEQGGDVSSIGYYGVMVPLIAVGIAAMGWAAVLMWKMQSKK
ncbi:hypothetical protein OH146_09415 [Salinibacterium sp. SYSU T00001]|uniref:hypothetical protein n=1 Tax=Homoserinimonas sedimenticola TaxID=2986805 RepID=UPI0022359753|nr:hypothetical protein [Salinibacterium sedimenticola]MCW4385988.1 hypothetical protein [Salinibacterium sedimenticola]